MKKNIKLNDRVPKPEPLPPELANVWLTAELTLNDGSLVWWEVAPSTDEHAMSAVYLFKNGKKIALLKPTRDEQAEKFFWKYSDQCKAHGDEPVVTFCSFD
jgi:hypothetical protein